MTVATTVGGAVVGYVCGYAEGLARGLNHAQAEDVARQQAIYGAAIGVGISAVVAAGGVAGGAIAGGIAGKTAVAAIFGTLSVALAASNIAQSENITVFAIRVGCTGVEVVTGRAIAKGVQKIARIPQVRRFALDESGSAGFNRNAPKRPVETIYKAPQPGKGQKQLRDGFDPADFADGDQRAYFARQRELAEEYARHYGDGVLEVDIPKDVYDARIRPHEVPYQGGPQTELPIPHQDFDVLNDAVRRLLGGG